MLYQNEGILKISTNVEFPGDMEIIEKVFGYGKELSTLQMGARGIVIFIVTLVLLRISGRRSFGLRTPLDNIITIILGAVLSRAVVGASPFGPIVLSGLVIALMHRSVGWLMARNSKFAKLIEGNKIILFEEGRFIDSNMKRALVTQEHVMQGVRKTALTDQLEKVDRIYMERNGEISVIKKEN